MESQIVKFREPFINADDFRATTRFVEESAPEGMYIHTFRLAPGLGPDDGNGNFQVKLYLLTIYASHEGAALEDKQFQMRLTHIGFGGGHLLPATVPYEINLTRFGGITTAEGFYALCDQIAAREE